MENERNANSQTGRLNALAAERGIAILYACESGSRAWGLESPDSDWDVRFIYVHDRDWYLSMWPGRDTIEHPFGHMDGNMDFQGFDLRKALMLAAGSNPSVVEWLASPIVYEADPGFTVALRSILLDFSPRALMHHYTSLAERQVKAYWKEGEPVRLKKYLYALRPIMCLDWMAHYDYAMPPVAFVNLLAETPLDTGLRDEIARYAVAKRRATELDGEGRFARLDDYIFAGLEKGHDMANAAPKREPDRARLQDLFMATIGARP